MTWTEPEPRSVAFRTDWEPDPEELRAVRDYLYNAPAHLLQETMEDHCEGLAGGILQTLHVLRGGSVHALPEDEAQRYIAQAHAMGKEIERLRAENNALRVVLDDIYPTLASRSMQLRDAGEEKAAAQWSEVCRKVAETWAWGK